MAASILSSVAAYIMKRCEEQCALQLRQTSLSYKVLSYTYFTFLTVILWRHVKEERIFMDFC